jgi:uncharacterized protein DUF6082
MSMPSINPGRPFTDVATKIGSYAGIAVLLGVFVVGVVISPVAFNLIDSNNRDWNRLSSIGQSYGSVSALLSAGALCLVVLLQRNQLRQERISKVRDMHLAVVGAALDEPGYCQCWGSRMAANGIDERLFYYTNMILMLWWYSWEIGELRDGQLRNYAGGMFDSEVPREYWRTHGQWRLSGARGRRRRFLLMIDDAFRAAERSGPPVRRLERTDHHPRHNGPLRGTRRRIDRSTAGGSRRSFR